MGQGPGHRGALSPSPGQDLAETQCPIVSKFSSHPTPMCSRFKGKHVMEQQLSEARWPWDKVALRQGGPGSLSFSGPAAAPAEDTPCSLWQDSPSPGTCSLKSLHSCWLSDPLFSWLMLNIAHRGFLIWWRRRELILTALCHIEFASCFYCNLHLKINQQQSTDSCSPELPGLGIHV